ncbi:hypothetical protein PIB30_074704 [Stylosanthes scabra]|uniref:Uncharacterized protein n=1 Tax=Stylosanthes scabra TaxID=79078 RepID=A0ABU6WQZ4_9FABA|nr:hypothetical protein [Stylosanthes scabra]
MQSSSEDSSNRSSNSHGALSYDLSEVWPPPPSCPKVDDIFDVAALISPLSLFRNTAAVPPIPMLLQNALSVLYFRSENIEEGEGTNLSERAPQLRRQQSQPAAARDSTSIPPQQQELAPATAAAAAPRSSSLHRQHLVQRRREEG